jgi:hypothetical protein
MIVHYCLRGIQAFSLVALAVILAANLTVRFWIALVLLLAAIAAEWFVLWRGGARHPLGRK